jgi:hypothetical protein
VNAIPKPLLNKAVTLPEQTGTFGKWAKDLFGWSKQRTNQLMAAEETVRSLANIWSTIVDHIPETETQCRELQCIPKSKLPKVWQQVCETAKAEEKPITAKLIRDAVEPYRTKKTSDWDEEKAIFRIRDWVNVELAKWPEDKRGQAAQWFRNALKEEGL